MRKIKDLTGQRFGKLIVIERAEDKIEPSGRHRIMWLCKCECGNIKSVQTNSLQRGFTKTCGCCGFATVNSRCFDDLTGKRFGKLTVIEQSDYYISPNKKHKEIRWKCECDCGNICYVNSYCLKDKLTTSCGCYQREQTSECNTNNLIGQKFGKLTVVKKHNSTKRRVVWECICDCGNVCHVVGGNLVSGNTKSCGCINSCGETEIKSFLSNNGISFEYQKTFDNLYGIQNGKLSYDFYIPNHNLLIEYQGKQHEEPIEFFGGEKQFKIQQEHDKRKREYAKNNGYKLLEIWYYDDIKQILFKELSISQKE